MPTGLNKKDTIHLKAALESLPQSLNFLKSAILHVAKQDQEMLGSGEVDDSKIIQALQSPQNTYVDQSIADDLQQWLDGLPEKEQLWAGPIWFVQGFLNCYNKAEWKIIPSRPVAEGLKKITLEIPQDMKVKFGRDGITLSRRGILMVVVELNERTYSIRLNNVSNLPPENLHPPSPLVIDRLAPFSIGDLIGFKYGLSNKTSGAIIIQHYLLSLRDLKVEVGIVSKTKKSLDLAYFEKIISTIHPK